MRADLTTLIIVSMGAFFYWTLSGFKGTFNDYMSRYYDADTKYDRNYLTGLGLLFLVVVITVGVVS